MSFETPESRIQALAELRPGARIHLSGICGTGMSAVAALLKELGYYVVGSDRAFYPPMGDIVRSIAQELFTNYASENLATTPDLVVIGNAIRRDNPEALEVAKRNLPYASMPEVFQALLIGSREVCANSVVVAGTHGKTTTSAAVSWMLECAGREPGYFIGGVPNNLNSGIRAVGCSLSVDKRVVVLEGDEYDSAFFSKQPKFLSYRPDIAVVTSVEFDHADIYGSVEEIEAEFAKFVALVPAGGIVYVGDERARLRELAEGWKKFISCECEFYGVNETSDLRILERKPINNTGNLVEGSHDGVAGVSNVSFCQEMLFRLKGAELKVYSPLSGAHNAYNLLVTAAIGERLGLPYDTIASSLSRFTGVKRRQTKLAERDGITVIEDFAHHPTAVDLTLRGLRETYCGRRIVAVFEPRSNTSRRDFFQNEYAHSFEAADAIVIKTVKDAGDYSKQSQKISALDVPKLIKQLRLAGKTAWACECSEEILKLLAEEVKSGDVVVFMSNGEFEGIQFKFASAGEYQPAEQK